MKKQAYIKPEAWALMIQQSGDICDNIIKFSAKVLTTVAATKTTKATLRPTLISTYGKKKRKRTTR